MIIYYVASSIFVVIESIVLSVFVTCLLLDILFYTCTVSFSYPTYGKDEW